LSAIQQDEPWLRGTLQDVPAVLRAVLHAIEMAREDVGAACAGLSAEEVSASPHGLTPLSFHLRHIPASLDRLLTYAEGKQLSEVQKSVLKTEAEPATNLTALLGAFELGLREAEQRIRGFVGVDFDQPRHVGKKQLPTTVAGLIVHCADHTARHTGQVVTTAKLLRAQRENLQPGTSHGLQ